MAPEIYDMLRKLAVAASPTPVGNMVSRQELSKHLAEYMAARMAFNQALQPDTVIGLLDTLASQAGRITELEAEGLNSDVRLAAVIEQREKLRGQLATATAVEPMTDVADRYAHRLALELECVLANRQGYYEKAMRVLGEYRKAMNAIHEQHSPTHMGEPCLTPEDQDLESYRQDQHPSAVGQDHEDGVAN